MGKNGVHSAYKDEVIKVFQAKGTVGMKEEVKPSLT